MCNFLIFFQLSRSVRDDLDLTLLISLGQIGAETTGRVLVWEIGIRDQKVVPVVSGKSQCWLLGQLGLERLECSQGHVC